MPKKSPSTRGGTQRVKPKQKGFELVRPASATPDDAADTNAEPTVVGASTGTTTTSMPSKSRQAEVSARKERLSTPSARLQTPTLAEEAETEQEEGGNKIQELAVSAPKGSASARLASRRQAGLKAQQRNVATLITAEHYTYVRKDLIFIAVLAVIMFAAIIILHFVPGIGA